MSRDEVCPEITWRCCYCTQFLITRSLPEWLSRVAALEAWCRCLPWLLEFVVPGMFVLDSRRNIRRVLAVNRKDALVRIESAMTNGGDWVAFRKLRPVPTHV